MKNIYYKSSEGVIVNLIQAPYRMLTETELLNNEWQWETVGTLNPRIAKLKKELVSPPFKIRVTGSSKDDMLNNLEYIEGVFDRDCFLGQMGRLYIGDFYRECFITSSTKGKVFEKNHTVVQYVATSNDSYWRNDKTCIFSGTGMTTGEIAYSTLVTAKVNSESIVTEPTGNDDKELHIEYEAPFDTYDRNWLKFDIGSVIDVEEFSGLTLEAVGVTPIGCDLQIGDGETEDDSRSISVTANIPDRAEESSIIYIDDFTTIKVDSVSLSSATLYMYCYIGYERVAEITIKSEQTNIIGEDIDVSNYDYVTFFSGYNQEATNTVSYTVNEEQWTTLQSISSAGEVTFEDETCRYIRLKGSFFGKIDCDVSIISGEVAPPRDLFFLGFKSTNVSQFIVNRVTTQQITIYPEDETKDAYITFDDLEVTLKEITCTYARAGTVKVQGLNDGVWSDILTFENGTSETYNTHYDQIRLCIPANSGVSAIQYAHIKVLTDARIYNESYAPSDAIIEINGAWSNPTVQINGYEYGANIDLAQGHKLVIDTKNKTVRDYSDDITYENVYASRLEDSFTKIETGEQLIDWVKDATEIKITIEQARSTPKWN